MQYQLKPQFVDAWQLDWDNWKQLADLVKGKFHQQLMLSGTGDSDMHGYLELPNGQTVGIGNYVVRESHGGFVRWEASEFEKNFEPMERGAILRLRSGESVRLEDL